MPKVDTYPPITTLQPNDLFLIETAADAAYKALKYSSLASIFASTLPTNPINTSSGMILEYQFTTGSGLSALNTGSLGSSYNALLGGSATANSSDPTWLTWASEGLSFNYANSQFLSIPPLPTWSGGDLSIEVCLLVRSYQTWSRIFSMSNSGGANEIFLGASNSSSGQMEMGGGATTALVAPLTTTKYQWVHVFLVIASGVASIYWNNCLQGTATVGSIATNTSRSQVYIGKSPFSGDGYLDGCIALFRLYNRAILNAERLANYQASRALLLANGIIIP